ncbi:MAG: hypothetical protein NC191_04740 [Muribaculaceae bacterium]|nr:hypothetical protein [Muribaculaceae bacterium]
MIKINNEEILTVIDGITWAGSKDSAVRTLDFKFLYNPLKADIPKYQVQTHDKVEYSEPLLDEQGQPKRNSEDKIIYKTLFLGYITKLDYNTDDDVISVSCVDLMSYLKRSKCVKRFRGTLNQIANEICGAFELKSGINVDNTHVHNIVSTGDKTYYDILFIACKSMWKNFNLYMDGITLKLAEHTSQGTYKIGYNIRSSSFSQDISEIITKVLIVDNEGNLIKPIENTELREKYGLFQDIYSYNKEIKNNVSEAEKQIKPPVNNAFIVCDNDNNCISGRYIKVLEPVTQKDFGFFEIQTDSHTIGADSSMQLEIKFIYNTSEMEGVENYLIQ